MSFDLDTLYNLLPTVYRIRDLEQVGTGLDLGQSADPNVIQLPLKALLKVMVEQIGVLEENLAQLYDDQFIETCAEWAIPYIGDLIGYSLPHDTSSQSQRSEIANTIGYRRRKGTVTVLEQLVRDVTGWDAHLVEYFQLLATTQHMLRPRPVSRLVDLRRQDQLDLLDTPFEQLVHTADLRNTDSLHRSYNVSTIGIFAWRLNAYPLTDVPAAQAYKDDPRRYLFSPLGNDVQLFTNPRHAADVTHLAGPLDVAMPITRSMLERSLADYYGPGKSILLTDGGKPIMPDPSQPSKRLAALIAQSDTLSQRLSAMKSVDKEKLAELIELSASLSAGLTSLQGVDAQKLSNLIGISDALYKGLTAQDLDDQQLTKLADISASLYEGLASEYLETQQLADILSVCDLGDEEEEDKDADGRKKKDHDGHPIWKNVPQDDTIAIDPVLGRIVFPESKKPGDLHSTFYYGFSADMGGGEYHRSDSFAQGLGYAQQVPSELQRIQDALNVLPVVGGVVEITDSGTIEGVPNIAATANQRIELRAADFRRPLLVLQEDGKAREMEISGDEGSQVTLNGLVISHAALRVTGKLDRLTLRHCTLVPGHSISKEDKPRAPSQPSLIVESTDTLIEIDHCIVGRLHIAKGATVHIANSIVDATDSKGVAYTAPMKKEQAVGAKGEPESREATFGGPLRIENSTIIGSVRTVALELASNTIFLAVLENDEKDEKGKKGKKKDTEGPLYVEQQQEGCARFSYLPAGSKVPLRCYHCQLDSSDDARRIELNFTSLRYGEPGYCQLGERTSMKISQGADDGAEMGAFHDLYQPQRKSNLLLRLQEYLRFGFEIGIVYIT